MNDNERSTVEPTAEVENLSGDERQEWLKTGELPSEKPALVVEEKDSTTPVEGKEPEEATNFKPAAAKPNQMGYKALRDRVKQLEQELSTRTEPPAEARQPISTTEPKAEKEPEKLRAKPLPLDVDDKGKPKYATYEDYVEDLADWKAETRLAQYRKEEADSRTKAQAEAANQKISQGWAKQVEDARKHHADFDTVALNKELPIPPGSAVEQWILRSDMGTEILYHLGKNPDLLSAIHAMHPVDAARELVLIEAELSGPPAEEKPGPKKVSSAPPPAREVGSRQAVGYDPAAEALAEGDFERYRAAENAKELKSKRKN